MNKLIIHPTDFSDCSNVALEYAVNICQRYQAELLLVHALDPEKLDGYDQSGQSMLARSKELENEAREKLNELGTNLVKRQINCRAQFYNGKLSSWLNDVVDQLQPIMVVMGTTGAGSIGNQLFGSNAYSVISSSSVPVLAIPTNTDFQHPKKISLAADLKHTGTEAIDFYKGFCDQFDARAEIIYVSNEEDRSTLDSLIDNFKKAFEGELEIHTLFKNDYIEAVKSQLAEHPTDMLGIIVSDKNFIEKMLFGSLSKDLIHHSKIPLLALPASLS